MLRQCARHGWASSAVWALAALAPALLLNPAPAAALDAATGTAAPEKVMVVDGSFVHDVGRLACNVTNWGLIGSRPSMPSTFSDAPSCQWPQPGAADYLWGAGLWVGAVSLGQRLVSTGQYEAELRPTDHPLDTLYRSAMGAAGGHRYPETLPDDDADGLEDEDPLNGRDDDGDGLIDEDFAAVSEQYFRCEYADTVTVPLPNHEPLGLEIVQQSYQWSDPYLGDAIGLDFTIRNGGSRELEQVYLGFFADCDVGLRDGTDIALDDLAGSWEGFVTGTDQRVWPVSLAYMRDADGDGGAAPGYLGFVVLDHPTDSAGLAAPAAAGNASIQIMNALMPFELGGDPTNDTERYALLSAGAKDPDHCIPGDYRVLIASGPFAFLAPGETLFYRLAMVMGTDLQDLRQNAAKVVQLYSGAAFDRDGDPTTGENGRELVVHWLRASDTPQTAQNRRFIACAQLDAWPNPANPRVNVGIGLPATGLATLSVYDARGRRVRTLLAARQVQSQDRVVWDGADDGGRPLPSGVYELRLSVDGRAASRAVTLVR